ncbi:MAG: hypothetical protein AAB927_01655 [Patescibacteria group bacterium]
MPSEKFGGSESFEEKGIPPTLQRAIELQAAGQAPEEPIEPPFLNKADYIHVRDTILNLIERTPLHNPYHNVEHTRGVEARFLELARHSKLSAAAREWGGLRALLHDFGHCGQTIRQAAPADIKRRDLSNEEYAALRAHTLFSRNFQSEQIIYLQTGILATSFGQTQGEYMRQYRPVSDSEKLLAFADIAGCINGFQEWMVERLHVLEEAPRETIPADFEKYLAVRKGFVNYCSMKLRDIEPLLEPSYYAGLEAKLSALDENLSGNAGAERFRPFAKEFERIRAAD